MRALIKDTGPAVLAQAPSPELSSRDQVLIRVRVAGICRTDLAVARGLRPQEGPLILGHELCGVIEDLHPSAKGLRRGERVSVDPRIRCGHCATCLAESGRCLSPEILGVHRDGAFAELLAIPASAVIKLPPNLPDAIGAYVEPLAAALAVLHAGLVPSDRVLLAGDGRIATLTARVLEVSGFGTVARWDPGSNAVPPANAFDAAIESIAEERVLTTLVRALRPGGRLVLKSRSLTPIAFDFGEAVKKELTLAAVAYGDFEAAARLLAKGRIVVEDLLGPMYPLADYSRAFAEAEASEARKVFLTPQAP